MYETRTKQRPAMTGNDMAHRQNDNYYNNSTF